MCWGACVLTLRCGLLALERGLDQPFPLPLPGSAARRPLAGGGGGQGGVETDRSSQADPPLFLCTKFHFF